MKSLRLVPSLCAALFALGGCGGLQPSIGAPGAMAQSRPIATHAERGRSWMLPEAKSEGLLYATGGCLGTCVLSYPAGKLVGTLGVGGGYDNSGDCADGAGNVFISNNDAVVEYAHGSVTPIATLDLPGSAALGCSVDPTTGDLAVVFSGSGENVAIFSEASGTPTTYNSGIDSSYCGYDNAGDLFVDGYGNGNAPALAELPSGGSAFSGVSVSASVGTPGQVQWDGDYITYESRTKHDVAVSRLEVSGSEATIVSTTQFDINKNAMQSWIYKSKIFIPYDNNTQVGHQRRVGAWQYPRGGKPTASFQVRGEYRNSVNFQAVTFSPALSR